MDYKEELAKILSNGELDDAAKTEAISKLTGDCFVSKATHKKALGDIEAEKKGLITERDDLQKKVKSFEDSKLTDDERKQKALEEIETLRKETLTERNKVKAEKILAKVIDDENELEQLISQISTDDEKATSTLAQNIADTLTRQKEQTETRIREEILKDTPKPTGGDGEKKKLTKDEFNKLSYEEQVNFKQKNPDDYNLMFGQ
ncbi:MAG: hypothetical protein ACI4U9_05300 [Clostridia bacterium]